MNDDIKYHWPTPLDVALELPEIKALVEAGNVMANALKGSYIVAGSARNWDTALAALTTQSAAPMKCAECDCDNPPHGCNWIKAGPSLAEALELPEIKALVEALNEIGSISPLKKNCYPEDWREQIKACPECQRYANHPVQQGICDDHRKPIYEQADHDRHEEKILGYQASQIARDALAALQTKEGEK